MTHSAAQLEKDRKSLRAFTLIEILVVLAILGLVGVFGSSWLLSGLPKIRVENAARTIQSLIYQSRVVAMRRSATVAVSIDVASQVVTAFYLDSGERIREIDLALDTGTRFVRFAAPPGEGHAIRGLSSFGAGEMGLVFERDGTLRDTGGVRLVHAGHGDYLEVSATTQSGVVEILKYLKEDDAPGGTAGFYPKANDPATGAGVWVWYGSEG